MISMAGVYRIAVAIALAHNPSYCSKCGGDGVYQVVIRGAEAEPDWVKREIAERAKSGFYPGRNYDPALWELITNHVCDKCDNYKRR